MASHGQMPTKNLCSWDCRESLCIRLICVTNRGPRRYQMGSEEFLVSYNWYSTLDIAIQERSQEHLSWTLMHETQDYSWNNH
ncbi:hypothetical protein KY284_015291 [Solanum tuberosum]|nr:hypothetical protein KY284_015291 [Solanum tuberosum]